jgi:putative glutamate--cysteine ligase/putative amino acid ligase
MQNTNENKFFEKLREVFIGVPVEGESGYINLMRIKARYFENVLEPRLRREIDEALQPFPNFREELFDKLYTFFRRYFTKSGSLGFFFTPYHQSVYEQVYTNEQDVVLFWKTSRLYYVKTDRLFQSMTAEVDGFRFYFDVSQLEHKRANEKREIIYAFKERRPDGTLVFTVHYSERGRQTKPDDIRRAIRDALGLTRHTDAVPAEETLQKAFRLFERQSEVDYFLCKDAKSFLREQFDLWMWQYLLGKPGEKPQTEWEETRLAQLQALKRIAYRVIDYIAAFEDELVKIWNKPKFVLNSHYVITLDRIAAQPGGMEMLERLWAHPNMEAQLQEWRELGMVDDKFQKEHVWEHNLVDGKHLHPRYRYLPIDTKYFPDLELPIVALFDNLDDALDGWLIKSENYQALNTILPKFRGKVKCTYIDPPYNTKASEIAYINNYKHASWLSLLNNRIARLRELLTQDGILCVTIDETEYHRLYGLLLYVFRDEDAILGTVVIRSNPSGRSTLKGFAIAHEYAIFVSSGKNATIGRFARTEKQIARYQESDAYGRFEWVNFRKHGGANAERTARPKLFYPIYVSDKDEIRIPKMKWDASSRKWLILEHPRQNEEVVYPISSRGEERTWKWGHETARKKIAEICAKRDQTGKISIYLKSRMREEGTLPLTWWDKREYSATDYGTNFIGKLFGKTTIFSFPSLFMLLPTV